jgi:hypothetical protein
VQGAFGGGDARIVRERMAGRKRLESATGRPAADRRPGDNAAQRPARRFDCAHHRPGGLPGGDDRARRRPIERTAGESGRDEPRRICGVNCRTKNVVDV